MPEAAGRGEGETADGKVTWLVDRCRLRINTRKRHLARMAPRKYGNP
jgi:hypothetical protein